MIQIRDKQILINGKPELIIAGEIHYFRLPQADWQDRIDKLKIAGCNGVASYIPWLCHEFVEGDYDFNGRIRQEHDLEGFIDLCAANNLYFFARPGPFIMAEMKNEGLPYWLYEKYPEIVPVTWDGRTVPTPTVDYLAPNFLKEARLWYQGVMGVLKPRLITNGGNVIAVQLDNEVGMLSWVSNSPDLTDQVLIDFALWLKEKYDSEVLASRYKVNLQDLRALREYYHSPQEEYVAQFMQDLGSYMRWRFAKYISLLRIYAEEFGVKDIPFVVNVHGTGGNRGLTYPIGISQLYESYTQTTGYLAGSDYYLGDISMQNFQDLYLCNAFMDAVNLTDQPLTSVEFSCGDGNYGNNFSGRIDPSSNDFAIRMCIAQGNRLLNCYLFCGGINYSFTEPIQDGNNRIAITGERHGFAAPISPEGEYNYTFPRMAQSFQAMMGVRSKLANMREDWDEVSFAFIPDYYMTEYCYPESEKGKAIRSNIESNRGPEAWENVARAMLLLGFRFGAVDIQNRDFSPQEHPTLVVPLARYLSSTVQQKLVDYLERGGKMLIYGELPQFDLEGNFCTLLIDALGVKIKGEHRSKQLFYLSVQATGWLAPQPEIRGHFALACDAGKHTTLLRVVGTGDTCAFDAKIGEGRLVFIGTPYPCNLPFFTTIFDKLGVTKGLWHDNPNHGIFMTSNSNHHAERLLHILNLDGFAKDFSVFHNGEVLFSGERLKIGPREALMLPLMLRFAGGIIQYATTELVFIDKRILKFRLTQDENKIVLCTDRDFTVDRPFRKTQEGQSVVITIPHPGGENPFCTLSL